MHKSIGPNPSLLSSLIHNVTRVKEPDRWLQHHLLVGRVAGIELAIAFAIFKHYIYTLRVQGRDWTVNCGQSEMAMVAGTAQFFVTNAPSSPSHSHGKVPSGYGGIRMLPRYDNKLNAGTRTRAWTWCWRGGLLKESCLGTRSVCVACLPSPSSEESDPTNLFVSGLSFFTTEESFRNAFSQFGQLVEAKIIMDRFAQRSKGFGFVRYATKEEAEEAIKGMDGKFLDGRVIFVEVAKPRPKLGGPPPRATGPRGMY